MDEPIDTIFEESEVLWAKIRGYPWWPAYVSEVHFAQAPQDYQYTVIFFGDNTNSRLGPSKLRKFPDFYAECYAKSKTNKKLKQSIDRAQERLNQNNQDVTIYQGIRNEMKIGKKKKGTMSQSRLSSSQKGQGIQPPQLGTQNISIVKYKTDAGVRATKSKNKPQKNQIFQNSESEKQQQSEKSIQSNNKNQKKIVTQFNRRKSQIVRLNPLGSPIKPVQLSISHEQLPNVRSRRSFRGSKQIVEPVSNQKQKVLSRSKQKIQVQQQEQQKQQSMQQQQQQSKQKIEAKPQNQRIRRGRKGRPSKLQQIQRQKQKQAKQDQQHESSQQQVEQQKSKTPLQSLQVPAKRGRKKNNNHNRLMQINKVSSENQNKTQVQVGTLSEKQAQKIKNSLSNRKQLIKILLQMPINAGNVKQILDLGVSLILQQGPITKSVYLLLCTLKATLLHKYFPDDNKHRRKYQKMTKQKRKIMMHQDFEDHEQILNSQQQNNIKMEDEKVHEQKTQEKSEDKHRNSQNKKKEKQKQKQKQKQAQQEAEQKQKLQQIRMKANAKLQKMIRKAGLQQGAKQLALKIQTTFQETAHAKGDLYRTIAYERMRTIKTKLGEFSQTKANAHEIKHYLQQLLHTYHAEGTHKHTHR